MEFVGIKELSQQASRVVNGKGWVVITKNGKPVKLMINITGEELEDLLLAKHFDLEAEAHQAIQDADLGKLKSLDEII